MTEESSQRRLTRLETWQHVTPNELDALAIDGESAEHAALLAEIEHLHRALASQPAIDQAKGILMARFQLDPDAAFAVLTRLSQDRNVKVREIALAMVAAVSRDPSSPAPQPSAADAIATELLGPTPPPLPD